MLDEAAIKAAKPQLRPTRLYVGRGVHLLVHPSGGKWWRLKYRFHGREKQVSLGLYPEVSLAEARQRGDGLRRLLASGIDPSEHLKAEKAVLRAEEARQHSPTRFLLDHEGALAVRLGRRCIGLSPAETAALRTFLDATRAVTPEVPPCP